LKSEQGEDHKAELWDRWREAAAGRNEFTGFFSPASVMMISSAARFAF
jgi:hypothetical protein